MARRSILQTLRQPAMVIPPIVFPLLLVAINVGGPRRGDEAPGLPGRLLLDFAIAVPFIQGALFAAINAGTALARDVETGFIKRLAMTPMQRMALLFGQLIGVMVVAFFSAMRLPDRGLRGRHGLQVGRARRPGDHRARGARSRSASPGSAPTSGCGRARARPCRGSSRCCSSSCSCPRSTSRAPLIEQDWFRTIATYNPVSYLVEGVRSLIITGLGRRGARARVRDRAR